MSLLTYQGKLLQSSHKYLAGPVALPYFPNITIGTQTWMQFNADASIPGSFVYNDDEANRPLYGGLYNYADLATLVSYYPGYKVPTISDYSTLAAFLGGTSVAGTAIKEVGTTYWNSGGTNSSGFGARGGGMGQGVGSYVALKSDGYYLTTDPVNLMAVFSGFPQMYPSWSYGSAYYFSVRLIKI